MEGRPKRKKSKNLENDLRDFIKNNINKSIKKGDNQLLNQNNFILKEESNVKFSEIQAQSLMSKDYQFGYDEHNQPFVGTKSRPNTIEVEKAIKVAVRLRPFMEREAIRGKFVSAVEPHKNKEILTVYEYFNLEAVEKDELENYVNQSQHYNLHQFAFDSVFGHNVTQEEVYQEVGKPVVLNVLDGYNGSILAYGQTGTGKTHTMEGFVFSMDEKDHPQGMMIITRDNKTQQQKRNHTQSCRDDLRVYREKTTSRANVSSARNDLCGRMFVHSIIQ